MRRRIPSLKLPHCCLTVLFCALAVSACGPARRPAQQNLPPSQRPYTVRGERYEPIRHADGFAQNGMASWYGRDFHGKKTSNGEVYDMNAMTAAHKTLPLGVFVRVVNKENGREAVVRINDRGPFVKGRIIDLSYAAAAKLGVDRAGLAPVRIEALGYRDAGGGYTAPAAYDRGEYTVQVGSFKDKENALRLSGEMRKRCGYADVRVSNVNGERYYRVYAGRYGSLVDAEAAERSFGKEGFPGSFAVARD